MEEIWKPIPEYEGYYEASNLGRIRRIFKKKKNPPYRIMAQHKANGYWVLHLTTFNITKMWYVHRLITAAFLGPCPEGKVCNHKDGDRANSKLKNLEYCTRSENTTHAWHTLGKWRKAFRPTITGVLSKEKVQEIKELLKTDMRITNISRQTGVSYFTVIDIQRGRRYKS